MSEEKFEVKNERPAEVKRDIAGLYCNYDELQAIGQGLACFLEKRVNDFKVYVNNLLVCDYGRPESNEVVINYCEELTMITNLIDNVMNLAIHINK